MTTTAQAVHAAMNALLIFGAVVVVVGIVLIWTSRAWGDTKVDRILKIFGTVVFAAFAVMAIYGVFR